MTDSADRITRRAMLSAAGRLGLLATAPAALAACAGPRGRRGLDELSVVLDGEAVSFSSSRARPRPARRPPRICRSPSARSR